MLTKDKVYALLFVFASLFCMEMVLKILTAAKDITPGNVMISLLFSFSIALVIYLLCSLFESRTNYLLMAVILGATALFFASQLVYFKIFKTYYSLYSAGNAGQVFEFWRDAALITLRSLPWLLVFFIPVLFLVTYGKKHISFERLHAQERIILGCCIVLAHAAALSVVSINGKQTFSAYDLYFNSYEPVHSTVQLGLLTTMRIDFQRLVFHWSPELNTHLPSAHSQEAADGQYQPAAKAYQTMDIDFTKLAQTEKDPNIKQMDQYFANVEPTSKNSYTGKYKGYNLILITAESFSPYAVREDVTPTLYKLVHQGYNFKNFYNPLWGVSTSDGEYVATTSLIPKSGVWSYYQSGKNAMPFAMGNQLKKLGYKTAAYHDHTYTYYHREVSHPNMGYEYKGIGNGLNMKKTWPSSDLEMMQVTVPEYIQNQPFHTYYMTVSGHMQYNFMGNQMAMKNKKYVDNLPYSEQAKAYIATQIELDHALEYLLAKLEDAGVADKTLIALSADHYPYGLDKKTIDELAGHKVEENFELYKSPFILYTKGMKPVTIDKPASSLDIIPTLSNLMGLPYDSRLLMGRDIFSEEDPLVVFLNKSFITNKGRYNSVTNEFTPAPGVTVDPGYADEVSAEVSNKFNISRKILETDYYRKVIK